LRALVGRFNNLGLVAAAYNAGPKRVLDWLQQRATLPRETRDYVSIVTGRPVEEWRGLKKGVVFNVPRQVPCHQSAAFSAVAEAERAAQLREVAEQQRLAEKEREAARLQKKNKLAAASRSKFRPAAQNASPASLRRAASGGDKRLSVRRNLRSA
jgi:soluble lytic murein transglycosylase-like protein